MPFRKAAPHIHARVSLCQDARLPEADVARRGARSEVPTHERKSGPRPKRAVRNEADWMSADILKIHALAGLCQHV